MKTAIMQPYLFPYIVYFQLMSCVDIFVLLDDVNFIMRGWVNRNNILVNGKKHLFSIPLEKPSQNKWICDTKLNFNTKDKNKFLKTIQMAYNKAPFFNDFYPILEDIILYNNNDLIEYIENSLLKIFEYLEHRVNITRSSKINKANSLKAENKIIEICKHLNTKTYINLSGGRGLYKMENFKKENIELKFIDTVFENTIYHQFNNNFVQGLSIIDIIMFNSKSKIKDFLNSYNLSYV
jgi:hypothetical protein